MAISAATDEATSRTACTRSLNLRARMIRSTATTQTSTVVQTGLLACGVIASQAQVSSTTATEMHTPTSTERDRRPTDATSAVDSAVGSGWVSSTGDTVSIG